MQVKVPAAKLVIQNLPMVSEIELALIDSAYPQANLTDSQIESLMDEPPYWAFCWASGQVLARYLLDHPEVIRNKTVIDFGAGSGVVSIAAYMAGAARSIALDLDRNALEASQINAKHNNANVELENDINSLNICRSSTTLLIADVFYDRNNIPLLKDFIENFGDVIVADSRIKPDELIGMIEIARHTSCTVPDLAESSDFNSVGIFRTRSIS